MNQPRNKLLSVSLFLHIATSTCLAQLQLGDMSLMRSGGAPALTHQPGVSVRAPVFRAKVGGVAFNGTAKPLGEEVAVISKFDYYRNAPDGKRLRVEFEGVGGVKTTAVAEIYDWQLIPIVEFADSDHFACFTLFGELEDKVKMDSIQSKGGSILNYHAAFQDTLLGLRLFQSDILLLTETACDLPSKGTGRQYILGSGEVPPDLEINQKAFQRVKSWLDRQEESFESYVITDLDQEITFSVKNGQLRLTGEPIWDCWKTNEKYAEAQQEAAEELQLEVLLKALVKIGAIDSFAKAKVLPFLNLIELIENQDEERLERALEKEMEGMELEEQLRLRADQLAPGVEKTDSLENLSVNLSAQIFRDPSLNPTVLASVKTTMRFAAFFRFAKKTNPTAFESLANELKDVVLEPKVETPDHILIPERAAMVDFLRLFESLGKEGETDEAGGGNFPGF